MSVVIFKVITYGEEDHKKAINLRKEVLYKARGISADDYNEEDNHIQIAGFFAEDLIATCSLVPEGDTCRMRYVDIKSDFQGSGIGSKMLKFFEELAKSKGFKSVYCHARDIAVKFYKTNGYATEGEVFVQVTIPHIKMRKIL